MSSKLDNIFLDSYIKTAAFGFSRKNPPESEEQIEGMYENLNPSNIRIARNLRNRPIPVLASQNLQSLGETISKYSFPGSIAKRIMVGFLGAGLGAGVGYGATHLIDPMSANKKRNAAIGAALGGLLGYSREKTKQRERYEVPMANYNILRAWAPDAALQIDRLAAKNLWRLNRLQESRPLVARLAGV